MSIRDFFIALLKVESQIAAEWVVVMSQDTSDGGKAGRLVEVSKAVAARMIVKGSARLASDLEAKQYRDDIQDQVERARAEEEASRVHVTITRNSPDSSSRPTPPSSRNRG
jgi:hypothetical protein